MKKDEVISSPLRWTGSKKKLLNEMLEAFDEHKSIYVEPFLGSGIVMLNVIKSKKYTQYYVNDINDNVIDFYNELKSNSKRLVKSIKDLVNLYNNKNSIIDKELFYYTIRTQFNEDDLPKLKKASFFWFLMKTGFNGVYRVNSKNKFNVPFGKKEQIVFDSLYFFELSKLIKDVNFLCMPYKEFMDNIKARVNLDDCFIYCDPPYLPETSATINHTLYTKDKFKHDIFIKYLSELMFDSCCSIMVSMSESDYGKLLYGSVFPTAYPLSEIVRTVNPKRTLRSKELAYTNYELNNIGNIYF